MSAALAVEADGLVKTFGKGDGQVRALDGVSLQVPMGTVLGLLGPNGAGKTTAVNILTTLLKPDAGRAEVVGVDVVKHPARVRNQIGLAGQFAAIDENLTGEENLALVGRLNHLARSDVRARTRSLLSDFGLSDAGGRLAKTYSGGMRRRLDLAAALVARPPVLFLDEPTTGLDPRSRVDLWKVIEDLVADGTSLLLTTQYLEEADRLADRISVVDHGRVIAEGTSAELKSKLGSTVVEARMADEDAAEQAIGALKSIGDHDPARDGVVVRLTASDGPAALSEVVRALDASGLVLAGLQVREPSLDDVFLSLTGHRAEDGQDEEIAAGADERRGGRRSG
ncbi:MAG: daunorubicin/doxorubicin resistance ABC transporter ATP-binding protein DrrA [Pseudonocardiales bacterium]|nr:MAG: daunorubicin/doxorubicin resistance ABC transporter ATP-binding protein DrrA [Pseudonocardiales bacterium]